MVYCTDRSKAVVPVLIYIFVASWFILRDGLFFVLPCVILFLCFSPFSIAITSLEEERANLSAFRTFVRFVPRKSVGNLTNPGCSLVNVIRLFGNSERRKRSSTSALQSS